MVFSRLYICRDYAEKTLLDADHTQNVHYDIGTTSCENLSSGLSNQVWLKLACSATVANNSLEILDIASIRGSE